VTPTGTESRKHKDEKIKNYAMSKSHRQLRNALEYLETKIFLKGYEDEE